MEISDNSGMLFIDDRLLSSSVFTFCMELSDVQARTPPPPRVGIINAAVGSEKNHYRSMYWDLIGIKTQVFFRQNRWETVIVGFSYCYAL